MRSSRHSRERGAKLTASAASVSAMVLYSPSGGMGAAVFVRRLHEMRFETSRASRDI